METRVGLVGANGLLVRDPVVAAGPASGNRFDASVVWTGSSYLVGTNEVVCAGGKPCAGGVTVSRFTPGPGSEATLAPVAEFLSEPTLRARTPQLARQGGGAVAVWREVGEEPNHPQALRVVRLDASGQKLGSEARYSIQASADPLLVASDQGSAVLYSEVIDSAAPDGGHSVIHVQQHGKTGQPLQLLDIRTSTLTPRAPYAATTFDSPRGILIAWTGAMGGNDPTPILFLTFLQCEPVN